MSHHKFQGSYFEAYKNQVRDIQTPREELPDALKRLGRQIAQEIMTEALEHMPARVITTPLGKVITGKLPSITNAIVITTKEETSYLGTAIADELGTTHRGYIQLGRVRGKAALTAPIQEVSWPTVQGRVPLLVVGKSVLASGCTAIALVRHAVDRFQPAQVVIAAIFYSEEGLAEMSEALPNAQIYVLGDADQLTPEGLLSPGVGMLEERLLAEAEPLYREQPNNDELNPPEYAPDSFVALISKRIEDLYQTDLTSEEKISPLEIYMLVQHYSDKLAAAQSAGRGTSADITQAISADDLRITLVRFRNPSARIIKGS